ncbi:WhiB family transcriptional regulator [Streptomyces brasiliensis]|uniref:Transcriptional regulator WhiB n=1 Tax=Streptomyces brasiliensis TaxID=1954 RepID=A0A917NUK5_9ACTN|nr:WhiB family transcriptional regulator [Streptomyces brasiliensis]GGJ29609.1 transcriptional regulator WhiB [Streptomyces brasiliensis]
MDDWRDLAACRDEDPDLFFPISDTGRSLAQTRRAKSVCHRCPVREPCLRWALRTGQAAGIWGGTTEAERRVFSRQSTG